MNRCGKCHPDTYWQCRKSAGHKGPHQDRTGAKW